MESKSLKSNVSTKEAYISDPSLNFDLLNFLDDETDYSEESATIKDNKENEKCPIVENPSKDETSQNTADRFLTIIDQLDVRVENFRKDALSLLEMRECLLTSIAIIQESDEYHGFKDSEREEITDYIMRVNCRLATVDINVHTIRDQSQQDSLYQINELIDFMITINDPPVARQQCQQYLNVCGGSNNTFVVVESSNELPEKNFESVLLGCTLDDQKVIKKRLTALMNYLNQQNTQNQSKDI